MMEDRDTTLQAIFGDKPVTAEQVLESYNGNITRCAEALGISNATLRKYRDTNTLADLIVYNSRVYAYKNNYNVFVSNVPTNTEHDELVIKSASGVVLERWERVSTHGVSSGSHNIKITRDRKTGRVQYWRRKD